MLLKFNNFFKNYCCAKVPLNVFSYICDFVQICDLFSSQMCTFKTLENIVFLLCILPFKVGRFFSPIATSLTPCRTRDYAECFVVKALNHSLQSC